MEDLKKNKEKEGKNQKDYAFYPDGKKKRILYDYGLPFSKELAKALDSQLGRVSFEKKASLIIYDGGIGEGKTTLMVHSADYLMGAYEPQEDGTYIYNSDKIISFTNQLAMGGKDFSKKLKVCHIKKLIVVIYDEAGDFSRRGALTRLNGLINRIFETYRGFKIVVLLGLPSLRSLDGSLLDKSIIRMGLHCYDRNPQYGNFKAYSLYRLHYIMHKMSKMVIKSKAYSFTYPNFRGHFLDLQPKRSLELDDFSTKGKFAMMDEGEIKFEGLVSYSDMASKLNLSVAWVKKKVVKLKIKEKRFYKKRKYFLAEVLDKLADEIGQ